MSTDIPDTINAPGLPVVMHAQYLKDMSFENPNAAEMLRPGLNAPEIDMNINIEVSKVDGPSRLHEVLLSLKVGAKRDDKTVFLAEVVYGSLVSMQKEVTDAQAHPILFIEVPQLLFPYIRHIISLNTQSGGYPPLMLNPIDFRAMYVQRFASDKNAGQAA